jgi:peroxiredoxin
MKNFLSVFAAAFLLLMLNSCEEGRTGGNVIIKGKLSNCSGDTIYLMDMTQKPPFPVLDSVVANEDGEFELRPTIQNYYGFYQVNVGSSGNQFLMVIAKLGDNIMVTGDAKDLGNTWKAEGSDETKRFGDFNAYMMGIEKRRAPFVGRMDSIQNTFQMQVSLLKPEDSLKVDSLDKIFGDLYIDTQGDIAKLDAEAAEYAKEAIDKDPSAFSNIPMLRLIDPFYGFSYYERTIDAIEKKYPESPNVKLLRQYVESQRASHAGIPAPDIILNDPNGKTMKLSDLKGKIVLLDFWASWCKPCRTELPNVVANYNKHHDKGFEVFSVSLDSDKQAWVEAIKKDGLVWPYHVSDLRQWQSSVVPLYSIKGIPKTVLIDREGNIMDKDLRGEALTKKLDEVFAETK